VDRADDVECDGACVDAVRRESGSVMGPSLPGGMGGGISMRRFWWAASLKASRPGCFGC